MDSLEYRKKAIERYNQRTGDSLMYFNPDSLTTHEPRNVYASTQILILENITKQKCFNGWNFRMK